MIRIVTVCTANLCRSPLAELALRRAAEDGTPIEVRSTGVEVRPGRVSPPDWCDVVEGFGFDLRAHRSAEVDLDEADLVIGMTAEHLRRLAIDRPVLLGRLVTLRGAVARLESLGTGSGVSAAEVAARCVGEQRSIDLLRADERFDVADPYRRSRREQERVASEIIDLAQRFVRGVA